MLEVVRRLIDLARNQQPVVFCSVVETRGSTPQKPGAGMLVLPAGGQVGTLGGGCIEAEVRRRALGMLHGGQRPVELLRFHLDNDYGWDDGLICGGRMTILAERLESPEQLDYFSALLALLERGQGYTEAVVLEPTPWAQAGARLLIDPAEQPVATLRVVEVPAEIIRAVQPLSGRPRPYTLGPVAFMPVPPRCRLIIVGAGHVGKAVAMLASQMDFEIWVVDDRSEYASRERFPAAAEIFVGDIPETLRQLPIDEHTYVLIVTRGHRHDEAALHAVVDRPARYIGMIGSKRKVRLIFEDLEALGVDRQQLERVYAPVGFDIGSQTVAEIALSIVAQLVAHRNRGPAAAHTPLPLAQQVRR